MIDTAVPRARTRGARCTPGPGTLTAIWGLFGSVTLAAPSTSPLQGNRDFDTEVATLMVWWHHGRSWNPAPDRPPAYLCKSSAL